VGGDDPAPTGVTVTRPDDWVFAVDFGTTNTVAAVGGRLGIRSLMINGRTAIPSAVRSRVEPSSSVCEPLTDTVRRRSSRAGVLRRRCARLSPKQPAATATPSNRSVSAFAQ